MGRPARKTPLKSPRLLIVLTLTLGPAIGLGAGTAVVSEPPPVRFRTQARLTAALERPLSASWKGIGLRSLLGRLERDRAVSIVLDRRVDPEQEIDVQTGDRSLRSAVDEIARLVHMAATRVGNCLVIAPLPAASRLRTLVTLRERELAAASDTDFSARRARLRTERATIRWNDLDRPADIVRQIGRQFGLTIGGIEQIPHDLWAAAVVPEATAAEALSVVLNQFDLTFEWTDRGSGMRLVAVPSSVAIEQSYALRGRSPATTLQLVSSKIEGIDAAVRAGRLVVRGTVEQHEAVAALLGLSKESPHAGGKRPLTPLDRQSFVLQAGGVNLRELFEELKKQGLKIDYNAAELQKAGIDLKQKVSIDLPRLPARQFFARLLDPYGLTFHFDHATVVIEPK